MSGYMIIRCGKMKFLEAQIVYIFFLGSLIPFLFFCIQMILLPDEGTGEWGKFWGTVAQTDVMNQVGGRIQFQYNILWEYEPREALIVTFIMCVLLSIMTGLVLYLFCIWRKKVVGVCLIGALLTLPKVVEALNFTTFYWLSPYSWICLDTTRKVYNGALPSIRYGISMLCAVIVFLLILIYISGKKQKDLLV